MNASRLTASTALVATVALAALMPGSAASSATSNLGLGGDDLPESRTTEHLQPGVTLTSIARGRPVEDASWTVEVAMSANDGATSAVISSRASAHRTRKRLEEEGFDARTERVDTPRVGDYSGRTLGYRVRVGHFPDQTGAETTLERLRAKGHSGSSVFTGWDPDPHSTGPWKIELLTVDPREFEGHVVGSYGPDLEHRETTSRLATKRGATAGVNAGFFVLDPASGAPGDPAGVGVYGGAVESEAVNGRPALVFGAEGRDGDVARLSWQGRVRGRDGSLPLDGTNRVPGKIRNCGGTADDQPTASPLHDVTCTDPAEVVRFTPGFSAQTPAGPGVEAILDRRGTVVDLRSPRGGPIPPAQRPCRPPARPLTSCARWQRSAAPLR